MNLIYDGATLIMSTT